MVLFLGAGNKDRSLCCRNGTQARSHSPGPMTRPGSFAVQPEACSGAPGAGLVHNRLRAPLHIA
jgi:hypothetical protein